MPLKTRDQRMTGDEIYRESFAKVRSLISGHLSGRPALEQELIVRIVHASADVELAGHVMLSRDALEAGMGAIASGAEIVVDTEMVKAGLYSPGIRRFGCKVKCYLRDKRVAALATKEGMTKTAAAVRVAARDGAKGEVEVVGNAPTALLELLRMVKEGKAKPALIVGVPCGFVNAAESKELLAKAGVPFITVSGPKGGSAVAASITNFMAGAAQDRAAHGGGRPA